MLDFRQARPGHESEITAMARAFHQEDGHPLASTGPATIHTLLKGSPFGEVYLLRAENETVGYCVLCFTMSVEFGGQVVILDDLYLKPEHRGRGLGSEALAAVEKRALALNAVQIFLEVEDKNPGASRLYERCGFRKRERGMMDKHLSPADRR